MEEANLGVHLWWANQGITYKTSRAQGIIWAPVADHRGRKRRGWSHVGDVQTGDIIVHCTKGKVLALGRADSLPRTATIPAGFTQLGYGNLLGHLVDVSYFELQEPIAVTKIASDIMDLHINKGPLNKLGKPKQSY